MRVSPGFPFLADKPVGEDAYYMLTVAWNIADGQGIVYNYDHSTTGIQPLSTFVYAGLAWMVKASAATSGFLSCCAFVWHRNTAPFCP